MKLKLIKKKPIKLCTEKTLKSRSKVFTQTYIDLPLTAGSSLCQAALKPPASLKAKEEKH